MCMYTVNISTRIFYKHTYRPLTFIPVLIPSLSVFVSIEERAPAPTFAADTERGAAYLRFFSWGSRRRTQEETAFSSLAKISVHFNFISS